MHMTPSQRYTQDLKLPSCTVVIQRFAPLTKEEVADLFRVTTRTIENWIEQEGLPPPVAIGNRVFWHPDVFYEWLDRRLRLPSNDTVNNVPVTARLKGSAARKSVSAQLHLRNLARINGIEGQQ